MKEEWKQIIHFFLMEQNSNSLIERPRFERRRVFRALTKIQIVLAKDGPEIFSGTGEVDETYVGGQWKNKRKRFVIRVQNEEEVQRNNRFLESFAGMVRSGQKSLMMLMLTRFSPFISRKVSTGSTVCPDTGKAYPELRPEDMFIVSSIMVKSSTVMEKEIISMSWRDSGDFSYENSHQKVE